ncbi:endonuclease V [Acinetobacter nosocomialis]|uniref:endonuclease V n=2 Tax=Acinetobacter nosocomialis TaxID=106654 RepID=UPI000D0BD571|nr:endonuclease V [Acinetobacter nosocomialis]MDC9817332.1 endonuclease V [Acinetobacter nosocomialis]MDE9406580.1 endonuclease V [Acinetobacter nosocomialis]PSE43718.1 endonuclease V [Acinetobacter nosocomialis]PSE84993.1 endonuclease V [Acinetobacter nosocomialis]HDG9763173.1 endonuclease V [Acinetobacter nosocomialis]
MILVVDVFYNDEGAKSVAGVFENWGSQHFYKTYEINIGNVEDYVPGQFYKRELPCILSVLGIVEEEYEYILIDGYVFLGAESKAGLGKHLWDALAIKKPIIGVAKNYFKDTPEDCVVLRGKSQKPLYITSIDIPLNVAKENIMQMYGNHRIPNLIKQIDLKSRS